MDTILTDDERVLCVRALEALKMGQRGMWEHQITDEGRKMFPEAVARMERERDGVEALLAKLEQRS